MSLDLDLKILWMAFLKVVRREDVGQGADDMREVDDLGFSERFESMSRKNNG